MAPGSYYILDTLPWCPRLRLALYPGYSVLIDFENLALHHQSRHYAGAACSHPSLQRLLLGFRVGRQLEAPAVLAPHRIRRYSCPDRPCRRCDLVVNSSLMRYTLHQGFDAAKMPEPTLITKNLERLEENMTAQWTYKLLSNKLWVVEEVYMVKVRSTEAVVRHYL